MDLKIISPTPESFVKAIEWNHEEIKQEMAAKVADYKSMVYDDDQIKEAKKDKAELNKLIKSLEEKRKEIKSQCLAPYEKFEKQMKELVSIVQEPIAAIDEQVKAYEEQLKKKKALDIEEYFNTKDFHGFTLDQIFDNRWLNATTSMKSIRETIDARATEIAADVQIINNLEEYQFEAMEVYKATMNVRNAMNEVSRLKELAISKAKYEAQKAAEQKRIEEEPHNLSENTLVTQEHVSDTSVEEVKAENAKCENNANAEGYIPFEDDNFIPDFDDRPEEPRWIVFKAFVNDEQEKQIESFLDQMGAKYEAM